MKASIILSTLALLTSTHAAPSSNDKDTPAAPLVTGTPQPLVPVVAIQPIPTSTLLPEALAPAPTYVFIEPPPIFDPPEPRPETIFDSPSSNKENILRPPPIPLNRMERMSAFDGAKAHPDRTPYLPDMSDSGCGFMVEMMRLCVGVMVLLFAVYIVCAVMATLFRGCLRVVRGRRRTVGEEGRILLDETNIEKGEGSNFATAMARSRSASKVLPV